MLALIVSLKDSICFPSEASTIKSDKFDRHSMQKMPHDSVMGA